MAVTPISNCLNRWRFKHFLARSWVNPQIYDMCVEHTPGLLESWMPCEMCGSEIMKCCLVSVSVRPTPPSLRPNVGLDGGLQGDRTPYCQLGMAITCG